MTQSLGALPFNADEIQPDFAVAAGYKWLMGPYTSAFLYVAPKWQSGRPLEFNWMNRKDSQNFAGLTNYVDDYQSGASRYDMGEKSNPALLELRAPHYLGVRFSKTPPADILPRLAAEDIYVSIRGDFMRVTPHLFVTEADMSRFVSRLAYHLKK